MQFQRAIFLNMIGETVLVVTSSLFVIYTSSEAVQCLGYIGFHAILLLGLTYTELERIHSIQFRPLSGSGIELGCLLTPMVLTSQIKLIQHDPSSRQLTDTLRLYLAASQLMSMSMVGVVQLLNKSRQSWLLVVTTVLIAANINFQSDIISIAGLVILFHIVLLFLLWLCPKSFSIGEAMLISQAFLFLAVDSWTLLANRLHYVVPSWGQPSILYTRSIYTYWLQILLVGSLVTGLLLLPVFYYISIVSNAVEMTIGYFCFYLVIFLVFFSLLLPWTYLMLGGVNPFMWLIHYIIYSKTRYYLIAYWCLIVVISLAVIIIKNFSRSKTQSTTITRKYFHVLAIAVFLPGIILDPQLTHLAASVAIATFLFLEYVRLGRIEPFGNLLHESLQVFLDDKDTGCVILTHIYLLIGCALPVWLYPVSNAYRKGSSALGMFSGILSLGVGDTLASYVGKTYGRCKWPGTSKTVEGTVAGFAGQMILIGVFFKAGVVPMVDWIAITICIAVCSLLEAWTTQIDNLVLPPFLYALVLSSCSS